MHFKKDGTKYIYYHTRTGEIKPERNLNEFGIDGIPHDAVGAALKLELANRYWIFFDKTGTVYSIYKGGEGTIGLYRL